MIAIGEYDRTNQMDRSDLLELLVDDNGDLYWYIINDGQLHPYVIPFPKDDDVIYSWKQRFNFIEPRIFL